MAEQEQQQQQKIKETLDRLYNELDSPAAYAGVERLWLEAKKELGNKITRREVRHYLAGHTPYTLTRPRRVHFPHSRTIPAGYMTDMQCDLMFIKDEARNNRGYKYILVGIDVLSKQIYVAKSKTKYAKDMVEAFSELLSKTPMKPQRIYTDKGTEFTNKPVKDLMANEEIHKYETPEVGIKATLAERAIRNIRQRLFRYFKQKKTTNWVDSIQQIVDGINNSPSRTHGLCPNEVNFKNAQQIWENMYGDIVYAKWPKAKTKLKEEDYVRAAYRKDPFEKEIMPNWEDEILQIDRIEPYTRPVRYKLRNEKGKLRPATYYKEQLQPVRKEAGTLFRIERIFQKKKQPDGTFKALVKYIGYPERVWIPENELV